MPDIYTKESYNTMDKIVEYYNKFNEDKRLKSPHGKVEYIVTMKYIKQYLDEIGKGARILDVGAGTGAYSVPLALEGYEVHAIELVRHNVQRLRAKTDKVHALQGNALKLSKKFEREYFDLVLVFGPMYHLFSYEDKVQVLREAQKVTKPGGTIMVAYCMKDYAIVRHGFMEQSICRSVEQGKINSDFVLTPQEDDLYDYVDVGQIDRIREACGLERRVLFTPDGPANYIRPSLREMTDEEYDWFVKYVESISMRADMIGAAAHTVDVLKNGC